MKLAKTLKGFIAIDGINASGKGSVIEQLKGMLHSNVVYTHEPRGTVVGNEIWDLLHRNKVSSGVDALLMSAARKHHFETLVCEVLQKQSLVIGDRHSASTYAFQQGLSLADWKDLTDFATDGHLPEVTFILDIPASTSHKRMLTRQGLDDKFEDCHYEYTATARERYLELAAIYSDSFVVIDVLYSSPHEVALKIVNELKVRKII